MSMIESLKHKLEELKVNNLREWLNNNSAAVTVGSVALLLLALSVMVHYLYPTAQPVASNTSFYWDVVDHKLVTDKANNYPPITSAEGHELVRVHLFSCAECVEKDRFVGYYEKYTPETKDRMEKNPQNYEMMDNARKGRLYCEGSKDPAQAKNWVASETPAGMKILNDLPTRCKTGSLHYCLSN